MSVTRGNANDNLAAELGGEIVAGVYPEGGRLPGEAALLERFHVSRPTLREAFRTLASKGLIVSRKKVGASVRPRSQWSVFDPQLLEWRLRSSVSEDIVNDLFQLREMLEPPAAALAAKSRDFAAIIRLVEAFSELERAAAAHTDASAAESRFHQAILEAVGNPLVVALGAVIDSALRRAAPDRRRRTDAEADPRLLLHKALLTAIQAGEPEVARQRSLDLLRAETSQLKLPELKRDSN